MSQYVHTLFVVAFWSHLKLSIQHYMMIRVTIGLSVINGQF